jgi:deoxyhypusine synthase
MGTIRDLMQQQFLHFNARETRAAAQAWVDLLGRGGKMMVTLGGAMSTAELGISLARMIREDKVHAITCTGANLEEDIFNLVAHDDYRVVPRYRELTAGDEQELYDAGLNRVTDTCIPESVMRNVDHRIRELWEEADKAGESKTPWEFMRELVKGDALQEFYQVPRENSWVLAAAERNVPVWVPGWEDSTLGNVFTSYVLLGRLQRHDTVRNGTYQMGQLARWYQQQHKEGAPIGFFQIGGGIAGDFPICVVPMLIQDMKLKDTPFWAYFCQIGDSTTSYGSYSGAVPNEKITWGKLDTDTPRFMINSDASIVAPLVFAYVLDD